MFTKGNKIFYPLYGIGKIDAVEKRKEENKEIKCYKIKLKNNNLMISVPVSNANKIGIRKVIPKKNIKQLIIFLETMPDNFEQDWKKRFIKNNDLLKEGDIYQTASVIKELFIRNTVKQLSLTEKKQYENAFQILSDEIIESGNYKEENVRTLISDALDKLNKKLEAKNKRKRKK